jgi:hypothetical protein
MRIQPDRCVDDFFLIDARSWASPAEPAIEIDDDQRAWVRDPWEQRLHPASAAYTTPGGLLVAEAFYEGDFAGTFSEHSKVHLLAIQHADVALVAEEV